MERLLVNWIFISKPGETQKKVMERLIRMELFFQPSMNFIEAQGVMDLDKRVCTMILMKSG